MSTSDNRSPQQIESDIVAARTRLASTVDQLAYRVQPRTIVSRQVETTRTSLFNATHTGDGSLRLDVIAPVAAAVGGVLLMAIAVRRRRRRRRG